AQLPLLGESLFAQLIPALIEPSFVFGDPLFRNLKRLVSSSSREIQKERAIRRSGIMLMQPANCIIGDIDCEVIALFGGGRRLDGSGIAIEPWIVLVVETAYETVEVLKS